MTCFLRKSLKPTGYGAEDPIGHNWGIAIPHEQYNQGAVAHDPRWTEFSYALIMGGDIQVPKYTKSMPNPYESLVNADLCTAILEPHFNAYNGKVHGYEILVLKGDSESEHYARLFIDAWADEYPKRRARGDRGIKWIKKGDRGYPNLTGMKKAGAEVALLSEMFFGDNESDWVSPKDQADFWREHLC